MADDELKRLEHDEVSNTMTYLEKKQKLLLAPST